MKKFIILIVMTVMKSVVSVPGEYFSDYSGPENFRSGTESNNLYRFVDRNRELPLGVKAQQRRIRTNISELHETLGNSFSPQARAQPKGNVVDLNNPEMQKQTTQDNDRRSSDDQNNDDPIRREQIITRNIEERANFRNLVDDHKAYAKEIRKKIDRYAEDIKQKVGLNDTQTKELRLALSQGLMKEKEMLVSISEVTLMVAAPVAIVGGIATGNFSGLDAFVLGSATSSTRSSSSMGTDIRAFDYRSTVKRLHDVVAKPPFANLEQRLKLNREQIEKLESYRNSLVNNFNYKARTFYDNCRHYSAHYGYRLVKGILLGLVIALFIDAATHS